MSSEDYDRARRAVGQLALTDANAEVAAHWLSLWHDGKPPRMNSFIQSKILKHIPAKNIFEIHENESLRCIRGAAFAKLATGFDFTNQDMLALTNAADRDALLAWKWQIASGAVCVYYRSYKSKTESSGLAQGVALPFSDEVTDGARYILTHTNWRPVGSDWVEGNVHLDLQIPSEKRVISFREAAPETAWV
jgi:hypothetical protein